MAQCCLLQSPLICFRPYIRPRDACLLPGRCCGAHGMVETERSGSPWESLHSQSPTEVTKQEQVSISRIPWNNFTKTDTSVFPPRRGCLVQWSRSEKPQSPIPALTLICFVIWAMSLLLSKPLLDQMMPMVPSSSGILRVWVESPGEQILVWYSFTLSRPRSSKMKKKTVPCLNVGLKSNALYPCL